MLLSLFCFRWSGWPSEEEREAILPESAGEGRTKTHEALPALTAEARPRSAFARLLALADVAFLAVLLLVVLLGEFSSLATFSFLLLAVLSLLLLFFFFALAALAPLAVLATLFSTALPVS